MPYLINIDFFRMTKAASINGFLFNNVIVL